MKTSEQRRRTRRIGSWWLGEAEKAAQKIIVKTPVADDFEGAMAALIQAKKDLEQTAESNGHIESAQAYRFFRWGVEYALKEYQERKVAQ